MKKPAIPGTGSLPVELARVIEPIKQNVEMINGARPGSDVLTPLPATASLADVIAKVNQLISRVDQNG
ncbi:MAG: hypothetical protein ABFD94_16925 [Armatimonadia bacterium]